MRSVLAVIAGLIVMRLVAGQLELTLVNALAGGPTSDMDAYFAVLNRPGMLAGKLVYTTVVAILAGYISAKIAQAHEVRHGIVLAALQALIYASAFSVSVYAHYTPVWMRIALVVLTGPAMILGASIRARAARATVREVTS